MCILTHILKTEEMSGRSHFHILMMKSKRTNKRNINIVNSLILQTDFVYIWFLIFIRKESIPSSGGFRYKQIRMNECMQYFFPAFLKRNHFMSYLNTFAHHAKSLFHILTSHHRCTNTASSYLHQYIPPLMLITHNSFFYIETIYF